jgi:hypothetical protein
MELIICNHCYELGSIGYVNYCDQNLKKNNPRKPILKTMNPDHEILEQVPISVVVNRNPKLYI